MDFTRTDASAVWQLLFAWQEGDSVLLDAIALEPLEGDQGREPAGTPITLVLSIPDDEVAASRLVRAFDRFAAKASVCRVRIMADGEHRLLLIVDGDQSLVVNVGVDESGAGPG
ncbi:MAG: hypothetical protein ACRD0G_16820 [Acidimicrobiales bacterium]